MVLGRAGMPHDEGGVGRDARHQIPAVQGTLSPGGERFGEGPRPSPTPPWRPAAAHQLASTLIAREGTTTIVTSAIDASSIISIFARAVSGIASVVLNAVAVEKAR